MDTKVIERFWADKSGECWVWTASLSRRLAQQRSRAKKNAHADIGGGEKNS